MSGTHSLFAPSKAAVWVNCFGALAATQHLPDEEPNEAAASGTFTHAISERVLKGVRALASFKGVVETHDTFTFKADEERLDRAAFYIDYVKDRGDMRFFEVKLDLGPVIGIQGESGTGDAVILDLVNHVIEVHDLKDGHKVVDADALQLITYGLAALHEFAMYDNFTHVRLFIHQPRKERHVDVTFTRAEMDLYELRIRGAAQHSHDLLTASPETVALALTPGPHCTDGYCRIRGSCLARRSGVVATIPKAMPPAITFTDAQLGELLSQRYKIEAFFKDLHAEAFNRAKLGGTIPGWKISTGRAGNRKWNLADEAAISDELYEVLEADAYERTMISPTTAEKKLKKADGGPALWATLQSKISRSDPALTLVPEADARGAIDLNVPEFADMTAADLIGDTANH